MTEDETVGWHHWFNGLEFEQAPGVGDRQGSLACCNPWGRTKLDTTERLNGTELNFCHHRAWEPPPPSLASWLPFIGLSVYIFCNVYAHTDEIYCHIFFFEIYFKVFHSYFLLYYSCFTMPCQFLLNNKVNQLCVYICPLPLTPPSQHSPSHPLFVEMWMEPLPSPGDLPDPGIKPSLLHRRRIL